MTQGVKQCHNYGMNMDVNEKVRNTVKQQMFKKNLSQTKLAEKLSMSRVNLTRLLSGRSGQVPESWQKVLDELGLELVAVPKGADTRKLFDSDAASSIVFRSDDEQAG